jgi:hypothetical protein
LRERKASEEFTYHEQKDPPKEEDVLASVNTSIINTLITSSIWLNVVALDVEKSKNVNEELQNANLPIDPLSLYCFVC